MTTVYTLRIDGRDVAGSEGASVLEVARENGIDIPMGSPRAAPAACAWSRSRARTSSPRPA
jgi:ferredoxin